ncbi:TPA: hypothetical protein PXM79_002962 [Yersinia enterocolitica]|nr:hypothetical protein [Yersinia enterocolitica]
MLSEEEVDRKDFETWFVPIYHPRHMSRNNAGDYLFIDAEIAWTAWKARSAELLSLREQLAELKALQPVAEMRTWPKNISGPNPDWFWFGKQDFPVGTQLFTAAKPAED